MGWIVEGRVRFFLKPEKRLPLLRWGGRQTVIPILEVGPGLEAEFIERLPKADALVLSLPGGGHVAESAVPLLSALPMPVIFASRTGAGETLRTSYGYPGGEIDLLARGVIAAGPLDARRARMAAAILLSGGATRSTIAEFFASI
jgi:L-asparaginase